MCLCSWLLKLRLLSCRHLRRHLHLFFVRREQLPSCPLPPWFDSSHWSSTMTLLNPHVDGKCKFESHKAQKSKEAFCEGMSSFFRSKSFYLYKHFQSTLLFFRVGVIRANKWPVKFFYYVILKIKISFFKKTCSWGQKVIFVESSDLGVFIGA